LKIPIINLETEGKQLLQLIKGYLRVRPQKLEGKTAD
jgi:hypothetical protein